MPMPSEIYEGNDLHVEYIVVDEEENALDITGHTFWITFKDNVLDPDLKARLQKSWDAHIDPEKGITALDLTSAETAALLPDGMKSKVVEYDIQVKTPTGEVFTLEEGKILVKRRITRATTQSYVINPPNSQSDNFTLNADTLNGLTSNDFARVNHTHSLSNLSDVDIIGLQSGQVLKWDSTANKWLPADDLTGSGGGAVIDDSTISTTTTWSSQKINNELSTKANASHAHSTSDIIDFNSSVDNKISAHNTDNTSHSDIRNQVSNKIDRPIVYTDGNLAQFDTSGNVVDSGKKLTDLALINHQHTVSDITDYDTETNTRINNAIDTHNTSNTSHTDIRNELANKLTKFTTFTADDIVIIANDGTISDSGKKLSDLAPANHTHTTSDISDYSTTTDSKINTAVSNHNTDTTAHSDIRNELTNKPNINDTTPSTTEVYSSQKVEDRLATKANATHTHSLNDLSDVNTSGATNGQALTYDSGSGLWIPATISGGGGSGGLWQHLQTITLTTTATEIHISGLNNDLIRLVLMLDNRSGVHTYLNMHFSSDNGATWYVPATNDWFGILSTATNAFSTFNGNFAYHKNNSWLAGDINIQRFSNGSIYTNAPTRSTSNNKWRHSQLIKNNILPNKITDIKIVCANTTAFLNTGSIVEVYGG